MGPKETTPDPAGPKITGARLFTNFRLAQLNQQVRAGSDPVQVRFLEEMRSFTNPTPISDEIIRSLSDRPLTSRDLLNPAWQAAPICVSTNMERYKLNFQLAQRFAKAHNTVIITWEIESSSSVVSVLRTKGLVERFFTPDSGLLDFCSRCACIFDGKYQ